MEVQAAGDWIETAPWRDQHVTLMRLYVDETDQAWTLTDKRQLLERAGGRVFAIWTGRHHSEVRELDDAQRGTVLEHLAMKPNRGDR